MSGVNLVMILTNFEILHLLESESKDSTNQDLNTLDFELSNWLHSTIKNSPSLETVAKFLTELKSLNLNLNKLEELHLINSRPKSLVELSVYIEEYQDRLSESQIESLFKILDQYFPVKV